MTAGHGIAKNLPKQLANIPTKMRQKISACHKKTYFQNFPTKISHKDYTDRLIATGPQFDYVLIVQT